MTGNSQWQPSCRAYKVFRCCQTASGCCHLHCFKCKHIGRRAAAALVNVHRSLTLQSELMVQLFLTTPREPEQELILLYPEWLTSPPSETDQWRETLLERHPLQSLIMQSGTTFMILVNKTCHINHVILLRDRWIVDSNHSLSESTFSVQKFWYCINSN